ncbi:MAG: VTT domain-containing protein [Burkholderiales bacterium]|nr:VTT domain-containing protein [Burkholderiales bacterium]
MRTQEDPWPLSVAPDLSHAPVGIARTQPEYGGNVQVQEIKQLYLDAIAAARRTIYIENQYLTAPAVVQALATRLEQPDGPEIVILSRLHGDGWLEESTMTALRVSAVNALRAADAHGRLRVAYPHADGLGQACIDLHSKLMIVDERFARIGSANLNNRSMGYDTECDLAIEATEPRNGAQLLELRHRLVAEHLGVTAREVAQARARTGSLIAAAATFRVGQILGRDVVRRIAGPRLTRLNHRLERRELLAIVTLRLLPIAPFTVINLAAGASQIRMRHFMLGTLIGMLPGIVAITLFSDRVLAAVRQPSLLTLTTLGAVIAAIAVGA